MPQSILHKNASVRFTPWPVGLPCVDNLGVCDAMEKRLVVKKVEQVLDGKRKDGATVDRTEDCLKEIVDKLLQCSLCVHKTQARVWHERTTHKLQCALNIQNTS